MTLIPRNALLLVGQVLLDHAANLPILVEMLADGALLVQWTADGLRGATDSSVRYTNLSSQHSSSSIRSGQW